MHFDEENIWYMFVQGIDFRLFVCLGFFLFFLALVLEELQLQQLPSQGECMNMI